MKIGILVTTYNRVNYLRQCLESLSRADMPEGTAMCIVDDCSDSETRAVLEAYEHPQVKRTLLIKAQREGIKSSIKAGVHQLINISECDLIINLDGDSLVRNDFVTELVKMHNHFPQNIVSGFDCTNKNEDGSWGMKDLAKAKITTLEKR